MARKKILEEEPQQEFEWDKKRIIGFFASLLFLIVGIIVVKHFLFDTQNATTQQAVQGISTQDMSLPSIRQIQQGTQQELGNLALQASKISVKDIASSSPQVQKILQQLQQLSKEPGNIAKQTCMQICNGL